VVSTQRISDAYRISKNHLVRVMQTLGEAGYVTLMPGRAGGVKLAKDPADIRLGDVVRHCEPHLDLVECFDAATNTCPIVSVCGLKAPLALALEAFLAELNKHTLAELLAPARRQRLASAFVRLEDVASASSHTPRR
jgi:Rrf2 family nitric oxide-sensitive transcriptional repressor